MDWLHQGNLAEYLTSLVYSREIADALGQLELSVAYPTLLLASCYTAGRSIGPPSGDTIPEAFVERARRHIDRTGHPYLEHRADEYRVTLLAQRLPDGCYAMRQQDVLERPGPTWRELFEETAPQGLVEGDFLASHGITADQWAEPADCLAADELVLAGWRPAARGAAEHHPLYGLPIPRFESAEKADALGCTVWLFDEAPQRSRTLVASSAMALSCLQFWLDERQAGVRLQVQ